MSTGFPYRNPRPSGAAGFLNLKTGLVAVLSILLGYLILSSLSLSTAEDQIYAALGCRSSETVLVLKLQPDGRILWPDTGISTVEESILLLPSWCAQHAEPVLAVLADPDTLLAQVTPLLEAADRLGVRRAILATPLK